MVTRTDCASPAFGNPGPFAGSGLCLADANGGEGIRLTPPRARDDSPSWSPDGRRLAFRRAETGRGYERKWIYVRDEHGRLETVAEEAQRARSGGVGGVADPDWSPDGQRVVYASWVGYIPLPRYVIYDLYTARSDGSDRRSLITDGNWNVLSDPQWSPNGNLIVFEHGRGISLVAAASGA